MNNRQFLLLAAMVAAAMACGDNGKSERVSVTAPIGATVVAHGADGAALETVQTGSDGSAELDVPSGGMVTVITKDEPGEKMAFTMMGVEPGDDLAFAPWGQNGFGLVTTAQVSLPGSVPDAFTYEIYSGCYPVIGTIAPDEPLPVDIYAACTTADNRFHAVALAFAMGAPYTPIAHAVATGIPAVVGGTTDVALPEWSTDWDRYELDLSGIPAAAVELSARLAPVVDNVPIELYSRTIAVDDPGRDLSARIPAGLGQRLELQLDAIYATPIESSGGMIEVLADAPATLAVDLERLMPPIRDLDIITTTPGRAALWWTSDGPLDSDGMLARLVWMADTPVSWEILIPPGAGPSVTLPELPGEVFAAPPSQTADYNGVRLWAVDSTLIADYQQLRTELGMAVTPDELHRHLHAEDSGAVIRYTTAQVERE